MSKEILISMIRKGKTGNEILMILDSLTESDDSDVQPTLEEIAF